jgi:NADH dehydrogenase [ubiquinone] 1 alpha subcomplex assembly factor 2
MSKLMARIAGYLSNRTLVGVDKVGNRYFTRTEEIDGISKCVSPLPVVNLCLFFSLHLLLVCIFVDVSVKEKRWVVFKGEEDPTSLPGIDFKALKFSPL